MVTMEEYFPFITKAFDVMQYTAWAVLFLIVVWQLFRAFGGPITEAENPWQLVVRGAIFALLIGYAKPIFMLALDIARAPYTALMDVSMTAEEFTFAGVEQALSNGLLTIVSTVTVVGPILVLILLVVAAFARKLCPYMSEEVVAASWCPSDGHANPLKATLGFYRKALQLGVTFVTGVKVMALEKVKGRIRKVITDDGVYEADEILLCAGYESRRIANTVGIDAPVERQFNEVLVTEAQPKMFDIMLGVAGGEFYGHQSEHGSFVLGGNSGLQAFTSNNDNFVTNSLTAPCISRGIIKYFPILENVKVVRTWSGWYDQCIDVLPVIDNIKEVPGLTVAFGFSGHGFGISPAVSIAVSELMLDGKSTTIDISQLTYDRFHAKG